MSSPPPAKKFRQATIWEGFKRQESIGTSAPATRSATRGTEQGRPRPQKEDTPLDLLDLDEDEMMENLTEEEIKERQAARLKRLQAAEKRLHDSQQNDNTNKKTTEVTKPTSLPATNKKGQQGKTDATPEGATASTSPMSPGSQEEPMSETQEYEDGMDDSAPLFDSDPNSIEYDELAADNVEYMEQTGTGVSLGVGKNKLNRNPGCRPPLPPLKSTPTHQVCVQVPLTKGEVPKPFPATLRDRWDNDHVKMPYSKESLYPVEGKDGRKELKNRWDLIQVALKADLTSSCDLEEGILEYNTRYSHKWDFRGLHTFFTEVLDGKEATEFFKNVLPKMVDLALSMPYVCTQPLRLLKQQENQSVTFSQHQAACLLANAFFCTYPRRNARGKQAEYSSYPDINFNQLFLGAKGGITEKRYHRKAEKLKCIVNYFRRVTSQMPTGNITFRRQSVRDFPGWPQSRTKLAPLYVTSEGTIEDDGSGMLQVDFANKYLGGGVLGYGLVQEEIRFMICPEMILSRLITQVLDYNECLVMIGCEQYSKYTGYGDTFSWAGNYTDQTPRDEWGRRCVEVVAIDALVIHNHAEQFKPQLVRRELNKAYCGFYAPGCSKPNLPAVATGNWGCGAFGGDHKLKVLIQLMAASEAGRSTAYFTFGNTRLAKDVHNMHTFLTDNQITIGELWDVIKKYYTSKSPQKGARPKQNLYEYIFNVYHNDMDADTDEDVPNCSSMHPAASTASSATSSARPPSPDWQANTP